MESKITIHTGEDHKPVIKIIEKDSEDVRDNLVSRFRELLHHESSTFNMEFISVPNEQKIRAGYYIKPVENEMDYFKEKCLSAINYTGCNITSEQRELINNFFDWMKNPTVDPVLVASGYITPEKI